MMATEILFTDAPRTLQTDHEIENNLIKNMRRFILRQGIYTGDYSYSIRKLYTLIDDSVAYVANYIGRLARAERVFTKPLKITDGEVGKMEQNCQAITRLSQKTNLSHQERLALMFTYIRFGSTGESRLRYILQRQRNYRQHLTDKYITDYKKQKKFWGISCKKMVQWGLCTEQQMGVCEDATS